MPALGKKLVRVTTHIRKLNGCSQSSLTEASDDEIYVVKLTDKQLGENLLFNEVMGTELYRACGLAVPPWRRVLVTDDFIRQNPGYWRQTPEGRESPSGVFFGSSYLGCNPSTVFEILPGGYFSRVRAADFWLAWLVDICASHTDNRQALFVQRETHELDPIFIDFGHMFGGPNGDKEPHFIASRYRDVRIYPRLTARFLLTIRRTAASLNAEKLWRQVGKVPDEWKSQRGVQNFATCLNRLADAQFVEKSLGMMVASIRSQDDIFPKSARHSGNSFLSSGIQVKRIPRPIARGPKHCSAH